MDLLGDISTATWLLALFGALSLGFSKTGFPGLAMVNVLILAELFGAKASVGMIVPMLIVCDLTVYPLFRRYSSWRELWPLLPSTFVGLELVTLPSALVHLSHPPIMNIILGCENYVLRRARCYVGDRTECFLAQIKKGGG